MNSQSQELSTDLNILYKKEVVLDLFKLHDSKVHGIDHACRVLLLVQELSRQAALTKVDSLLLEFCAVFHDVGRTNDLVDPTHGRKSVQLLEEFSVDGFFSIDFSIASTIIEHHCLSDNEALTSCTSLRKKSHVFYLFQLFKDADGLDRIRLGDFESKFLRLSLSHKQIESAEKLFQTVKRSTATMLISDWVSRNT